MFADRNRLQLLPGMKFYTHVSEKKRDIAEFQRFLQDTNTGVEQTFQTITINVI